MKGLIEIFDLPNWLYIIAVLSLLIGIITSIYFFAKTHYFIGEICFLEDSIEIKNKRGKQKYTYNQLSDLNVKINNRPERMPVNRTMIEGGRNYIEFTFRNAKEKFEFYIASKKEQQELMLLIEKLGIKFNVIENG